MAAPTDRVPDEATRLRRLQSDLTEFLDFIASDSVVQIDVNGVLVIILKDDGALVNIAGELAANPDDVTIDIVSNALHVKDNGIGADQLGILTTLGDLLVYTTEPARFGVGTDDFVLTADSSAPEGMTWKAVVPALLASQFIYNEHPFGAIDGVNTTYRTAKVPLDNDQVRVYQDGLRLEPLVDYTIA